MGKVDRRQMRAIQKKALKDVKHAKMQESSLSGPKQKMVMCIHEQMDELLHTDALVYQDLQKRKHVRVPKIRRINHRVR